MNKRINKLCESLTEKRFSLVQLAKTATILGLLVFGLLGYQLIREQKNSLSLVNQAYDACEDKLGMCEQTWRELEEKGEVIYKIKKVEK